MIFSFPSSGLACNLFFFTAILLSFFFNLPPNIATNKNSAYYRSKSKDWDGVANCKSNEHTNNPSYKSTKGFHIIVVFLLVIESVLGFP